MFLRKIRNSRATRIISFFLAINILAEIISPNVAMALTTGPSQPEVQSFEPINTSEMVDLFSGDFKYNIPLMDVGGYPLNINYNSGIGMDQEASWVGLGWNLNVGAITRNMRGLPDDFNGQDQVTKEFNMKDNMTYGGSVKFGFEVFGWGSNAKGSSSSSGSGGSVTLSVGMGVSYNNYSGVGVEQSFNAGVSAGDSDKGTMNAGLGMSSSASEGLNITPSVSFSQNIDRKGDDGKPTGATSNKVSAGIAMGVNSRSGLKSLTLNGNLSSANKQGYSAHGSVGAAGTVNFGVSTYVPDIHFPMVNNSVALSFKLGATAYGSDYSVDVAGYFSDQKLSTHSMTLPAYGYLYSHDGQQNDGALMDFNREKEGGYNRNMERLPITNYSYDVYSVAGQGVGGTYRPFRNDLGYVFDNEANTTSDSYTLGGEVDAANTAHAGIDVSVVDVNTTTGKWKSNNNAKSIMSFSGVSSGAHSASAEEVYAFKEVGEKSVDEDPMFDGIGGFLPTRIKLQGPNMSAMASSNFEEEYSNGHHHTIPIPTQKRQYRHKRNQVITTMTLDEAKNYGLNKSIYTGSLMPTGSVTKGHHMAEISVLRTDGSRYVYGLPAYNKKQDEVTFNITGGSQTISGSVNDVANGYVAYNSGVDDSKNNGKGIDNYYNRITTPAYAHSYMLTAVLSADYVDITGDGPTPDDLGNYTFFDYEKVADFDWRTPAGTNKANYNENTKKASPSDDYANYVSGTKDLFYVTQITTKNYVAIFETGDRDDAASVAGNGAAGAKKSRFLKSITLYAKPEYDKQLSSGGSYYAVPIKTAHFLYNYDLCKKVANNYNSTSTLGSSEYTGGTSSGGKLTLKQVYFTYGSSDKAKVNTYTFTYGGINPDYDPKAYDRWGNYKPNAAASVTSAADVAALGSVLPNWEFPYTDQSSQTNADQNSSAWSLTKITLPSGADINITYESDDYAFVQNIPAMDMCKVIKLMDNTSSLPSNDASLLGLNSPSIDQLMTGYGPTTVGTSKNVLIVKLPREIPDNLISGSIPDYFNSHVLKDLFGGRYMYFRFLTNMTRQGSSMSQNLGDYFEYVSGYAEIDNTQCGFINPSSSSGGHYLYKYAYITLKNVAADKMHSGTNVNPIAKAAWQMGRTHFSNLVWDANFSPGGGPADVVKAMINSDFTQKIFEGIKGPNISLGTKGYGMESIMNKSWVRLYDPLGQKFGGGCRVKTLTINDNWDDLTTAPGQGPQKDFTYGQTYSYTTTQNGETISSGVAAYEPMIGGDEIPQRLPNYYSNQSNNPSIANCLIPDERFFTEEPYGESFFPSANVGYSRVTVANLKRVDTGGNRIVKAHATGYVVHKFYTAKDYPTFTNRTLIDKRQFKPAFAGLTKVFARDFLTVSQGYVVELNDMHGKARGQEVYAEDKPNQPISKIEYFYKTQNGGYTEPVAGDISTDARYSANRLDNNATIVKPNGKVYTNARIGVDYDMVADFREHQTTTVVGGAQINLSVFLVGVFPGLVPTIWPDFSRDVTRFRSAVTTKIISRYALLDKTIATDLGSKVETSNLAYDAETGEVLLTRTQNDFEDQIYSFTYPAHWAYNQMGPAYKNIGVFAPSVAFSSGTAQVTNATTAFVPGDEISYATSGAIDRAWICDVYTSGGLDYIKAIQRDGSPVPNGTYTIKVLRSGRRNQQVLPIGSVVSLTNPIAGGNLSDITFGSTSATSKVLKTGAVEYSEVWKMYPGYTQTKDNSCNCTISAKGVDLANMFGSLISSGNLTHTNVLVYNPSGDTYSNGFTSTLNIPGLHPDYPTLSIQYWSLTKMFGSTAQFNIAPEGGTSPCEDIVATLPGSLNWSDITMISPLTYSLVTDVDCNPSLNICATYSITGSRGAVDTTCFTLTADPNCWPIADCQPRSGDDIVCAPNVGDLVNPFVQGLRGNWRTMRSWSYLSDRTQNFPGSGSGSKAPDVRYDGIFATKDPSTGSATEFKPFWVFQSSGGYFAASNPSFWTFTSQVTNYSPVGFELENKDALGRYSSALYGYNESLPIAVASNAQMSEVAYDGFEDYDFINSADCRRKHFNFYEHKANRQQTTAHTGLYSMWVPVASSISATRKLPATCTTSTTGYCQYNLTCGDLLPLFSPDAKKYVLSYWVKEVNSGILLVPSVQTTYANTNVSITVSSGGPVTLGTPVKSAIIDGWQRVEYTFVLPGTATGDIQVSLNNTSSGFRGVQAYFDDIRIHPFNSNIKTFVYNPVNLRYMAELDANNFATFYEYDEEGSLVRVKKETERGVMTIQETKNHTKR